MPGTFSGINMMSQAMRNFQLAMNTAGHNVSNVDTPGYSRQRVDFATNDPIAFYESGLRTLGQGVHSSHIGRLRDAYLDRSNNESLGNLGKFGSTVKGLSDIEKTYGEPSDQGILNALGKFFDSWSGLGSNPDDQGARFQVRNSGQVLSDRVRNAWKAFDSQQVDLKVQIDSALKQINDLASQIDALNGEIRAQSGGGQEPADLMDRRDMAIANLSQIVNVHTETFADGTIAVTAAGFAIVDSAGTLPFPTNYDPIAGTITNGSMTNSVRGGSLAGMFTSYGELANQKSKLDSLANNIRTQVNTAHMTGVNSAGTTSVQFFNDSLVQTGAIDFDLDPMIKTDVKNIMTGVSGSSGDGGLALSLGGLRDVSVLGLGSKTFGAFFQDNISTLSSSISYYKQAHATEEAVNSQIQNQISQVSGVNMDDEMADIVKFQRSYQAAAKTLSTLDQMTEDLLGMLRR